MYMEVREKRVYTGTYLLTYEGLRKVVNPSQKPNDILHSVTEKDDIMYKLTSP